MWGGVKGHVGRPWGLSVASVLVIVAHSVVICSDSCFRECQDHTVSPAIPVAECGIM